MKKLLKFTFAEKEGFFSVTEIDGALFTLAVKDTPKVKYVETSHQLLVATDLKNPIYVKTHVEVVYDQTIIDKVYHALEADNNLYFKQLDDTLCALMIKTK